MKNLKEKRSVILSLLIVMSMFITSCSNDDNDNALSQNNPTITQSDTEALLFMLEEEKLARDTYVYLNSKWDLIQFANISKSEQSHMNAIITLLEQYQIDYTILPYGEFDDVDLQNYYNQFVESGQISQTNALQIGATIEDLDIVDLEEYILHTSNPLLINVFESLQCGSGNHLRSFVSSLESLGESYAPQFLTEEDYNLIITGTHENCNL